MKVNLLVIIPALNEEKSISAVIDAVPKTIRSISQIDILVIDDGSTDKTQEICRNKHVLLLKHASNMGVGKALQSGVNYALSNNYDLMVNIDADGQFDPSQIPMLIRPIIENHADMVIGDRFSNSDTNTSTRPENMPKVKYWGNKLMTYFVNTLTGKNLPDVSSGFRAYSKNALFALNLSSEFTYTQEMIFDLAYKNMPILSVPVKVRYFTERESRVAANIPAYAYKTTKIILRMFRDYKPFIFFAYTAIPFILIGILSGYIFLSNYFHTGIFSPYKAYGFISVYTFTVGFALFILGFVSDMLVRLRLNQEKILIITKQNYYKNSQNEQYPHTQ